MKRRQYTPEKIIGLLRQAEVELAQRKRVGEVCRGLGISEQPLLQMGHALAPAFRA
jgi:hypothetical protein